MSLTQVWLLFFSCVLASIYLVRFIRKRHQVKQLLLTPIVINKPLIHKNPLLENRYIGIALSNTFDQTFARVHDDDIRNELIDIVQSECKLSTSRMVSALDLSELLSTASLSHYGTNVSFWLKELSMSLIEHLSTMVDDVGSTLITPTELNRLVEFCLHNVALAELEYA